MTTPTGAHGGSVRDRRRLSIWPGVMLYAVAACSPQPARPQFLRPMTAQTWAPALPATHEPLSAALTFVAAFGQGRAWSSAREDAFRDYVATLARDGPVSHPEMFPAGDDVLAYLVDAHVAWTLTLGRSRELAGKEVADLRESPILVDGRTTSLRGLAAEIAWRAPSEPRLALFLNPGWHGGPPLPASAVEGRALDWQLSLQADRSGQAPGFWTLDTAGKRLAVSVYTELMWGLPLEQPTRARRLLDLVPPPKPLLDAVVATCGAALVRCTLVLTPMDLGRLLTPEGTPRERGNPHTPGNRGS